MSAPSGKDNAKTVTKAITSLHPLSASTMNEICKYVAAANNVPLMDVRRTVGLTLRRGQAFGAIEVDDNGLYRLSDYMDHVRSHKRRSKSRSKGRKGRKGSRRRKSRGRRRR